jgi:hypothetical protein
MPTYTIYYAGGKDSEGYTTLIDVIRVILERWEDDEINATGIMAFLKANGRDFGDITDDNLADTSKDIRLTISDAVVEICSRGSASSQKAFVTALLPLIEVSENNTYALEYEGDIITCENCSNLMDVIRHITQMWADGDIDAHGTLNFLKAHGHDFNGLTDDDINEDTSAQLLSKISETLIDVCSTGGKDVYEAYIAALTHIKVVLS